MSSPKPKITVIGDVGDGSRQLERYERTFAHYAQNTVVFSYREAMQSPHRLDDITNRDGVYRHSTVFTFGTGLAPMYGMQPDRVVAIDLFRHEQTFKGRLEHAMALEHAPARLIHQLGRMSRLLTSKEGASYLLGMGAIRLSEDRTRHIASRLLDSGAERCDVVTTRQDEEADMYKWGVQRGLWRMNVPLVGAAAMQPEIVAGRIFHHLDLSRSDVGQQPQTVNR